MNPSSMKYSIPSINSESEIIVEDHDFALFLTQLGISGLETRKEVVDLLFSRLNMLALPKTSRES